MKVVLIALAFVLGLDTGVRADLVKTPRENFHIYLLIGQSNMAGRGDVSAEKVDSSRLLKWGDAGGWVEATEPLYRDGETAGAGPGMSFARAMADAEPNATVGLVSAAVGGTLLREWMPGCTFYTNAVARCRAALAKGGTRKFDERYQLYAEIGLDVLRGKDLWPDAVAGPQAPHEQPFESLDANTGGKGDSVRIKIK